MGKCFLRKLRTINKWHHKKPKGYSLPFRQKDTYYLSDIGFVGRKSEELEFATKAGDWALGGGKLR